jgi:hypothetical protein
LASEDDGFSGSGWGGDFVFVGFAPLDFVDGAFDDAGYFAFPFWHSRIELLWTVVRQCSEEVDEVGLDVDEI